MPINPYLPNQPVTPESFAGRRELIAKLQESIEAATSHIHRSTAFLLHGYRGSGKTSAIRKFQSILESNVPNLVRIEIQLLASSGDEKLLSLLLDNLRSQPATPLPFWGRVRDLLGRVSSVSTPVGGFQVSPPAMASTPTTSQALWNECMNVFEGAPLLFIAIDDADYLTDAGLGFLKTVAESHPRVPLILVVAGGSQLLDKMALAHLSPVARVFSGARFDIGELSRDETYAAIDAPPRVAGVPIAWTAAGRDRVFEYSHGYPYLIQCMAYAAAARSIAIDAADVDSALPLALRTGSEWMDRAFPNASDEDVRCFYKIVGTGKSMLKSAEMTGMGIQPPYIGRLVKARVLKRLSYGRYEVVMAPVIAYYHALRRGLVRPGTPSTGS